MSFFQIPESNPAVQHAAQWLRENFKISKSVAISQEFELTFKCKCILDNDQIFVKYIRFESEQELSLFLLKWS